MRLITLNTWGGKISEPLNKFFKQYGDTDIFCLQEIFHQATSKGAAEIVSDMKDSVNKNLYQDLQKLLPDHTSFFSPVFHNFYGLACFIKNDIEVLEQGTVPLYESPKFPDPEDPLADHDRLMQWFHIRRNIQKYYILNIHGHWTGTNKSDTKHRIIQSERIHNFIAEIKQPLILCGDFNARPDTKSMAILETELINLIKTHNITSTRTSLYSKEEKFADYILVSPEIDVKTFEVLPEEVSDHAALKVEF